ncbi:MAG TPA: hypothetical protein VGJ72_03730 [Polaromonas sp.]|jgi:hypothetical protein
MSIIESMVIDMNETQVRPLEQVLRRFAQAVCLPQLGRADRAAVLAYLHRLSRYSRAQITRLVSRWVAGKPLVKNDREPEHAVA